jgi:hypothetical protein
MSFIQIYLFLKSLLSPSQDAVSTRFVTSSLVPEVLKVSLLSLAFLGIILRIFLQPQEIRKNFILRIVL